MRDSGAGSHRKTWHSSRAFTNLCDRTGTRGQAGSDRRRRKQPCFREGGMTRRGEQWGNKAQSRLQLGHLRRQNSWQLPLCRILSNRLASLLQKKTNRTLTCVCIPDIRHPVLATREDKVPTWCESTIDPLSVVCGSSVLLHSQAEKGK